MKMRHVYRPPRRNRFLSTAVIFGGGAIFTFLVFYLIPLMQKLEDGLKPEEEDLVANITVAPEEEYVAPEEEPEPDEPEPEPEFEDSTDDVQVDVIDLPSLGSTLSGGPVLLNVNPSVAFGGDGDDIGAGGIDSDPVPSQTATPNVSNSIKKALKKRGSARVVISGLVDENGSVVESSVSESSGISGLDQAALKAFQKYKFKPAIRNGRKARANVQVPFDFRTK